MPSATPSDAEIAEWHDLSREEQLRRYREALAHPDCGVVTDSTMSDILDTAQELRPQLFRARSGRCR